MTLYKLYKQLTCYREGLLYWLGVGSLWMSNNKLLCVINKWQISTYYSLVIAYVYIWIIIGSCKLLIDGTKPLTEIMMTFINEVLWNLLRETGHMWSNGDHDGWYHIKSTGPKVSIRYIVLQISPMIWCKKHTYSEMMDFLQMLWNITELYFISHLVWYS